MIQNNEDGFIEEPVLETVLPVCDYTDRNILIWEPDDERRRLGVDVISDLLVGSTVKGTASEEEALLCLESGEWDTFVVDFYTEGVSSSRFIKQVNNSPDVVLVALSLSSFSFQEESGRFRQEPLRKLFDIDKGAPKPSENPES